MSYCNFISSFHCISNMLLIYFPHFSLRGYKRFFRRAALETSDFLKDDCLKINCTVGVVVSGIDSPRLHSIDIPDSDIGMHFGALLETQEGSDVLFNVAGVKFHAHKLILAARSPVFKTSFSDAFTGDKSEILVTDIEPEVFKASFYFQLFGQLDK